MHSQVANHRMKLEIKIPNSVTVLGYGSFQGCIQLKNVALSEGLQSIGGNSFHNCQSLECIAIPSSVLDIGESACNLLSSIVFSKELEDFMIDNLIPWWNSPLHFYENVLEYWISCIRVKAKYVSWSCDYSLLLTIIQQYRSLEFVETTTVAQGPTSLIVWCTKTKYNIEWLFRLHKQSYELLWTYSRRIPCLGSCLVESKHYWLSTTESKESNVW